MTVEVNRTNVYTVFWRTTWDIWYHRFPYWLSYRLDNYVPSGWLKHSNYYEGTEKRKYNRNTRKYSEITSRLLIVYVLVTYVMDITYTVFVVIIWWKRHAHYIIIITHCNNGSTTSEVWFQTRISVSKYPIIVNVYWIWLCDTTKTSLAHIDILELNLRMPHYFVRRDLFRTFYDYSRC